MPKRRNQEKIEYYEQKIKKLTEREHRKKHLISDQRDRRYKRIIYSSSEDTENNSEHEPIDEITPEILGAQNEQETQGPVPVPDLDSNILTALGESTEEPSKFGPKIHDTLSNLWLPILRKGINKDAKEKLLQPYPVPENCTLLHAPKLNPEISAAISDGARVRDKRVEGVQQQLGIGITALNKGLELLLDDNKDRLQAVKFLSDSCRILCDLHYMETEARKRFITPGLDKIFLNAIQEEDRDEMLFGSKVSEKIKAAKAIEKHGLQIKKSAPNPKTAYKSYQPSTSQSRAQGNWGGPSRPSTKGGEGGRRGLPNQHGKGQRDSHNRSHRLSSSLVPELATLRGTRWKN